MGTGVHPPFERIRPLARLDRDECGVPGPTRRIERIPSSTLD